METITVRQVLEKYPTQFQINNISDKLLNTVIFGNNEGVGNSRDQLTLNDLTQPTETEKNGKYKYTYKLGQFKLTIDNYLDSFFVDITWPSPEDMPPYKASWTDDGTPILY